MKPLTIEELKALQVGDWVWLVNRTGDIQIYAQIEDEFNFTTCKQDRRLYSRDAVVFLSNCDYGHRWLAYKNKEQAETKGEWVELPCIEPFTTCNIETGEPTTAYNILYRDNASGELVIDCEVDKPKAEARLKELRGEK